MSRAGAAIERKGLRQWDFGELPETFDDELRRAGRCTATPLWWTAATASTWWCCRGSGRRGAATRLGVRRLLLLNTTAPWKRVLARLSNAQKLALGNNPHGSVPALLDDCLACAVDAIVAERAGRGSVRDADAFEEVLAAVRTHVATRVLTVVDEVEPVLSPGPRGGAGDRVA